MGTYGKSVDSLVDQFVRYVNERGFEWKFPDEVPDELRTTEKDGMFYWQIRPAAPNPWVETLEELLPEPFPSSYRSLIRRYRFCGFEVGSIRFFANTAEPFDENLSSASVRDKHLYPTMWEHGYLEFGKRAGGHYDPMCFAMKGASHGDAPVVQLDHEEILIRSRIRVVEEIALSFAAFMKQAIDQHLDVC